MFNDHGVQISTTTRPATPYRPQNPPYRNPTLHRQTANLPEEATFESQICSQSRVAQKAGHFPTLDQQHILVTDWWNQLRNCTCRCCRRARHPDISVFRVVRHCARPNCQLYYRPGLFECGVRQREDCLDLLHGRSEGDDSNSDSDSCSLGVEEDLFYHERSSVGANYRERIRDHGRDQQRVDAPSQSISRRSFKRSSGGTDESPV